MRKLNKNHLKDQKSVLGFGINSINAFLHLHRSTLPGFHYLLALRCLYNMYPDAI